MGGVIRSETRVEDLGKVISLPTDLRSLNCLFSSQTQVLLSTTMRGTKRKFVSS